MCSTLLMVVLHPFGNGTDARPAGARSCLCRRSLPTGSELSDRGLRGWEGARGLRGVAVWRRAGVGESVQGPDPHAFAFRGGGVGRRWRCRSGAGGGDGVKCFSAGAR